MAQHRSAEKRARQNIKRHARNKASLTRMKTLIRNVRSAKDQNAASAALKTAVKALDQLASKGLIHENKAANQKSALAKFVGKMK
jgi:small subunit ribosomal protein S20